jgi:pimeloyl-ACP methyl ester carboxylesterase
VDWSSIGALGHSAGARVAAHLCQTERNVKGCLNLDGFAGFEPFFAEPGSTFEKRFAMIHMVIPDPTDAQLNQMGWSREDMLKEKARQRAAGIRLFESVRSGSIEITLSPPGMGHGSFTDLPLLGNGPPGDHRRAMNLIREFSRAFFDRTLKGQDKPELELVPSAGDVALERYVYKGPAPKQ